VTKLNNEAKKKPPSSTRSKHTVPKTKAKIPAKMKLRKKVWTAEHARLALEAIAEGLSVSTAA